MVLIILVKLLEKEELVDLSCLSWWHFCLFSDQHPKLLKDKRFLNVNCIPHCTLHISCVVHLVRLMNGCEVNSPCM